MGRYHDVQVGESDIVDLPRKSYIITAFTGTEIAFQQPTRNG